MSRSNNAGNKQVSRGIEIERLEIFLQRNPDHVPSLCQLSDLYLAENRITKASPYIKKAAKLFKDTQLSITQGIQVVDVMLNFWKVDRFVNKGNMRVNVQLERKKKLQDVQEIIQILHKLHDTQHQHLIAFKFAYSKENLGGFQDALTLLSDLITQQAMDNVDLSFIIFKAAVILKHIGESKQAIEYLEFLQEDPPSQDGYGKLHVVAFLILTYEQASDKYRVFLPKAYKDLAKIFDEPEGTDNANSGTQHVQNKKLEELVKSRTVTTSSELWEILAFQALDRCEYVMAAEFLLQATIKAPNKGQLIHCLMEVYYLLGEKDAAGKLADKAMVLLPTNADLRNLVLQIDPEKWADKLRFIGPTIDREGSPARGTKAGGSPEKQVVTGSNGIPTASAASEPAPLEGAAAATPSTAPVTTKTDKKGKTVKQVAAPEKKEESGGIMSRLKKVSSGVFQKPSAMTAAATTAGSPGKKVEDKVEPEEDSAPPPSLMKRKSFKVVQAEVEAEIADAEQRPATAGIKKSAGGKPKKPEISAESKRLLQLALQGNNNVSLFEYQTYLDDHALISVSILM